MKIWSCVTLAIVFFGCSSHPVVPLGVEEKVVSKEVYQKVLPAVYEVVIPKSKDDFVVYQKALPEEKLPYRFRNDKYLSIGTAFAVGENEFVSAAHVFPLYLGGAFREFYLRDQEGQTYAINRIIKYSSYRDIVSFSLAQTPSNHFVLPLSETVEVGDSILVVGNAQGEGISLRSGQVSSFTSEFVDNQWKFIRFSAPASPGNSGGPLLNAKGEVVGIVVRKNQTENLNYAVPIAEFKSMQVSRADFAIKDIKLKRDNLTEERAWTFTTNLPAQLSRLSDAAQTDLKQFIGDFYKSYLNPDDKRFFPANPDFQEYARHQRIQAGLGFLRPDNLGANWDTQYMKLTTSKLAADESIEWHKFENSYYFYMNKPHDMALGDFVENPKLIFERATQGLEFYREFAGEKIHIRSLGEPSEKSRFTDDLGRKWLRAVWPLRSMDRVFIQSCAPTPKGVVCHLTFVSLEIFNIYHAALAGPSEFNRLIWSQGGNLFEWKEYLKLGSDWLPSYFENGKVDFADHFLVAGFGGKKLAMRSEALSEKSSLTVKLQFAPRTPAALEIASLELKPQASHERFFSIYWAFEPLKKSSEKTWDFWKDFSLKKDKFDGKPHRKGDWSQIYLPLHEEKTSEVKQHSYVFCSQDQNESSDDFTQLCEAIRKENNINQR